MIVAGDDAKILTGEDDIGIVSLRDDVTGFATARVLLLLSLVMALRALRGKVSR